VLLGHPVGITILVAGAGERRRLLDQLTDIVANDGDATINLFQRKRTAVAHPVSPGLSYRETLL
jgi:hypothetical protein